MDELIAAAEIGTIGDMLLGVDALFPELRRITVDAEAEKKIRCGNPTSCGEEDGRALVYASDGSLLMLGELKDGCLYTVKSFFEV